MDAVERLKRDHTILRSKLDVLESALHMGPETWFVLREVSFTLARQLRDHMRREEELVVACRHALGPEMLAAVAVEHQDEPRHISRVVRLFSSADNHSLERIRPVLTEVIKGLREHMDEEERRMFPIIELTLAKSETEIAPTLASHQGLDETMTVNRVIQSFPRTRPIFERLFINIPMEGCSCLDEVAWRHGMEAQDLLKTIERAIASCECAQDYSAAGRG